MDITQLVHFYRTRGFECFETRAGHWMIMDGHRAVNIPPHDPIYPTREDIVEVFKRGAWAIRFCTTGPWEPFAEEYVLHAHPYELSVCKQKARNQVRASLTRCTFHPPTELDLLNQGLDINRQTVRRHGNRAAFLVETDRWRRYITTALAIPDVLPYAAYVDGVMVAYVLLVVFGGRIILELPFMNLDASKHCPMNGLLYYAINDARSKYGPLPISYGFGSIWKIESLNRFKLAMGFESHPRVRITLFARWIRPFINTAFDRMARRLPLVPSQLSERYGRVLEEKQLGQAWWNAAPSAP